MKSNGSKHIISFEISTDRKPSQELGRFGRSGELTGRIGDYMVDLMFLNFEWDLKRIPNAGVAGAVTIAGVWYGLEIYDELYLKYGAGVQAKLTGIVKLACGKEYLVSTRGPIRSTWIGLGYGREQAMPDREPIIQEDTPEELRPILKKIVHIATIAMLFDNHQPQEAEKLIEEWF